MGNMGSSSNSGNTAGGGGGFVAAAGRQLVRRQSSQQQQQQRPAVGRMPAPPMLLVIPPSRVYRTRQWDVDYVRKLIAAKKLAPSFAGRPEPTTDSATPATPPAKDGAAALMAEPEECPICFLYYDGGLNRTVCCRHSLCSECYLQINPRATLSSTLPCPFCGRHNFSITYTGPLSAAERLAIKQEEQKVHDLERQMREEEIARDLERERLRLEAKERGEPDPARSQQQPVQKGPSLEEKLAPVFYVPPATMSQEEAEEAMMREAIRLSIATS
eukprot:TRINITY_DN7870_c0_g1_i1.p1 TRINITY_DN7870_c0_g1~~TRINITY_DN7870_c0_g1_i1.p1  ORF type:complete len:287 (-),score=78.17 TRINITY_DN7870_c0_g1_i1:984-1802(-)